MLQRPPIDLLAGTDAAVGLWRDQRVRGEEILLPDALIVRADVLAEARVGLGEPVRRLAEGHQR